MCTREDKDMVDSEIWLWLTQKFTNLGLIKGLKPVFMDSLGRDTL